MKYDQNSVDSIVEYSRNIIGRSLSQLEEFSSSATNNRNRGDLGSLIEKYFFEIEPPNNHDPDFPNATKEISDKFGHRKYTGLELKTTGVLKKDESRFRAKERLVLTMISYDSIVEENFENSNLKKKCQLMLILFYLYDKNKESIDRTFVLEPLLFELEIPAEDLEQIRKDWEIIRSTVLLGKAHELSEGDNFYLGACRKGSGGPNEKLVKQPFSPIKAKSRAFSFKTNYVNRLIDGLLDIPQEDEEVLGVRADSSFNDVLQGKFSNYIGLSITEIANLLNYPFNGKNHKGYWRDLVNRILSADGKKIREFEKAGIELKTIRLNKAGAPREAMSFPSFDFKKIINEDWFDSTFCDKLERKFLFVIFQEFDDGEERLIKAAFWNMPYVDREDARLVWEKTKYLTSLSRPTDFPGASESYVAHVRPKGRDGSDKAELPDGSLFLKQCFWLNRKYIEGIVKNL